MDPSEPQSIIAAAQAAQRSGRKAEAARLFRETLARDGEHPVALNGLGMQALGEARFDEAAALFRRAIAADPQAPDLCMNLARAERERGDVEGERAALEAALALNQRHFMALVRLAELLDRTGDAEGAAERWDGVQQIAAGIEERSPAIEAIWRQARERVAARHALYAQAIDAGIGDRLAALAWNDRRRVQGAIDHALGRRPIYANRCAGLHVPFLPMDEFFDPGHFPWLAQIEAQTEIIRAELAALLDEGGGGFRPYVSMPPGTPENRWTPLSDNAAWSALHLWKDGVRNAAACARAPRTAAAVEALPLCDLPARTPTVFFSLLAPGAHLPAHTGVSNVRTIIHLPLIVPPDCGFRVGGETRAWQVGKALAFDDTIEHEAWNRSDRVRAVLIFDVWNPHLTAEERALLRAFYRLTDAGGTGGGIAGQAKVAVSD